MNALGWNQGQMPPTQCMAVDAIMLVIHEPGRVQFIIYGSQGMVPS